MNNKDFLPADYEEPVTSRYMRFEEGENKFRVLPAKPGKQTLIMGWEYWKTVGNGRKPVRVTRDIAVPMTELEVDPKTGELDLQKFFWAFAVWNYKTKSVQILEVTQKTIRQPMEALAKNVKWGTPVEYDLIVNQIVEGGKTSYSVTPDPKEPVDKNILEEYDKTPVNLEALYAGDDPFSSGSEETREKVYFEKPNGAMSPS